MCYHCYYSWYEKYQSGKEFLNEIMYKIKFKDYTYINIIKKKTFIKHFIVYFQIEKEFKHNYYSDLIKDESFLYKVWYLNFYKNYL